MKAYIPNKSMLYKLIIVCFLFLYLTGCLVDIQAVPDVLDFGETKTELSFLVDVDPLSYREWYTSTDVTWITYIHPRSGEGSIIVHIRIDRSGLPPGEYSGEMQVIVESLKTTAAIVTVKMTVPGDDDHTTTTTELSTTTTTVPVSTSTTTEPATTSITTTSIFIGDPPTINSISFFSEIIADGERNNGTVSFSDPDGDIVRAYFVSVGPSCFPSFDFDPMESLKGEDKTDGEFGFSIWCTGATRDFELKVTLKDEPDNESNSLAFSFTCTEVE